MQTHPKSVKILEKAVAEFLYYNDGGKKVNKARLFSMFADSLLEPEEDPRERAAFYKSIDDLIEAMDKYRKQVKIEKQCQIP